MSTGSLKPTEWAHNLCFRWSDCLRLELSPFGIDVIMLDCSSALPITQSALVSSCLRSGHPLFEYFSVPRRGLLGPAAYEGGIGMAILGTILHFVIAGGWAAIFAGAHHASIALRAATART